MEYLISLGAVVILYGFWNWGRWAGRRFERMTDPPTTVYVEQPRQRISYAEHVEYITDQNGRLFEIRPGPKIARMVDGTMPMLGDGGDVFPKLTRRHLPGFRIDVVEAQQPNWFCPACDNLNIYDRSFCAYCGSNRTMTVFKAEAVEPFFLDSEQKDIDAS